MSSAQIIEGVATSPPTGAIPLVKSDPEMTDWLARARAAVEKKEYAEAIKILQALIDKPDAGFVPAGKNARRFLPLRDVALRLLGEIPPEGLERYRRLYDPKARRKLDDALSAGDVRGIKTVAEQYRHTRVGPEAAEALGQWYFDRTRFAQAARTWRELRTDADNDRAALWMLKTVVAYHLAGDAKQAGALAKELRTKYPHASATLAGRKQNITAVLETYMTITPPALPPTGVLQHTYPGWGGLPTGQAVMPDTRAVLQPYWRYPAPDDANPELQINLGTSGNAGNVELDGGHVSLRIRQGNHRMTLSLPPLLRPVVVGGLVIYRNGERVIAVDARAGRSDTDHGWTSQSLPIERKLQTRPTTGARRVVLFRTRNTQSPSTLLYDRGRYSLTVGGGRIYTVCHFPLPGVQFIQNLAGGAVATPPPSGSSLAALSLRGQGKLDWIVGKASKPSAGGDAFLHECTFLSVPTYVSSASRREEGRLYTTVLHGQAFTLVCLDAATGRLYWKTQIAQTPVVKGAMYNPSSLTWDNTPMSPPAVAEDRVFVTTNSGVTAAFDTHTGQPIWAYQYGNEATNPRVLSRLRTRQTTAGSTRGGVNPMIVSDGVVVSMPVDADEVMAHSVADGTLLWRRARNRHLSALDAGRVCLAGKGVSVLRVSDGKELWQNGAIECFADPVATTNSLLLPGKGKLWRVALKDYAVASEPLQSDGLLGNLVSVDGKLIAANALGLCAYFDYDRTFAGLTERIKNTSVGERINLLQQRGGLSFNTDQYEEALKDYAAAEELTNSLPDGEEKRFGQAQLRQRRYRTFIALGNHEKDAAKALAWFAQAKNLARTNQEQAHMLIRTARLLERVGRFAEAVETAHALYEQYPEEEIVDVRIGLDVNPRQSFGPKDATLPGKVWAHQFIHRIIQIHSRGVYAKFDAQAEQALQRARAENTPEAFLAIQKHWPLSKYVDDALFAAAEVYYTRARKSNDDAQADENLRQCEERLCGVAIRQNSSHRPSALVALTAIYTVTGRENLARHTRAELETLPGETPIAFADIRGPLQKVLHDLDDGKIKPISTPSKQTPDRTLSYLHPPLRPIFTLDSQAATLLFDTRGNPIRLGQLLFVQDGDKTLLVDASADSVEKAVRGAAMTKIRNQLGQPIYAGISRDGTIAAVADNKSISVFRTDTCKLLWQADWPKLGCSYIQGVGIGNDMVVALDKNSRLSVFDLATGKKRWEYQPAAVSLPSYGVNADGTLYIPSGEGGGRSHPVKWVHLSPRPPSSPVVSMNPEIADGIIVSPIYIREGCYGVFDAKKGKLLFSHVIVPNRMRGSFVGRIREELLGNHRLAIAVNRKLTLYNLKDSSRTILKKKIPSFNDVNVNLLGWNRDSLAMRGPDKTVLLYTLHDPTHKPTTLQLALPEILPFKAIIDASRVYVFASLGTPPPNTPQHLRPYAVKDLAVMAFDPVTGKQLWNGRPASADDIPALQDITETQNHFVVNLWRLNDSGGVCLLIDKATGKVAQRLSLPGKRKIGPPVSHRRRVIVTDGRLATEIDKGITVYGQ